MRTILDYVKTEPAVLLALLGAAISLAAAFGFDLTAEQTAAITAFAVVVLGIVTRQSVTPNAKVEHLARHAEPDDRPHDIYPGYGSGV